jgi:hypothetical protein
MVVVMVVVMVAMIVMVRMVVIIVMMHIAAAVFRVHGRGTRVSISSIQHVIHPAYRGVTVSKVVLAHRLLNKHAHLQPST